MLKTFHLLGYFCQFEFIPCPIIDHIRTCLSLGEKASAIAPERSRRRYREAIRQYLNISTYNKQGQKIIAKAVGIAATVHDHPADLVNVAIEELVKERYELPAFSTLDRLVLHIRAVINNRLFRKVARSLSVTEISYLDSLLIDDSDSDSVTLNEVKQLPKKATLTQIKKLLTKFERLMAFGDAKRLFSTIATTKIKHFAAYARTLDAAEFQDILLPKRRTLLLSLIYQSQVKARDNLVSMFLKRLATIHNRGKERLEQIREEQRATTEALLGVLGEVLDANDTAPDEKILGRQVKSLIQIHGGSEKIRASWEEVTAYNDGNYLPLLWQYYSHYRVSLFKLMQGLELRSTTQDQSVIEAVTFLLDNEYRRGKWLPPTIELDFVSDILRKLSTYSRKNRLYQAFRELGRVVRTMFLLQYISDMGLRRQITACTNIVEAYNGFSKWLFFGKDGLITDNDPIEQEKRLKYLDLVSNSIILQNAFDISSIIRSLSAEGYVIKPKTLATLSPYLTGHLKRYGDYIVDFDNLPQPLETAMVIPVEPEIQ